jgi:hypothetical protein
MSEKDNSVLPLSFEIERQARIKRSLVIEACVRGTVRAFAEWLRSLVLRSPSWRVAQPLSAAFAVTFANSSSSTIVCWRTSASPPTGALSSTARSLQSTRKS